MEYNPSEKEPQPRDFETEVSFDEIDERQMGCKASVWISGSPREKKAYNFEGSGAEIKRHILAEAGGDLSRVKRIFIELP